MSYTLSPSKFLRHLALAYRMQNKNQTGQIEIEQDPGLSESEIAILKSQLEMLESKYAELILDKELDDETVERISSKIKTLKEKL